MDLDQEHVLVADMLRKYNKLEEKNGCVTLVPHVI